MINVKSGVKMANSNDILTVYAGLDLGSDTLKISYAVDCNGIKTGKIVGDESSGCAVPAVAYYDFDDGKWLFGENVERVGDKSFMGVVKIKTLLSLLLNRVNAEVTASNNNFYFNGNEFPKFYFPVKRKLPADYSQAVAGKMTFSVEKITPADICLAFFRYVNELICGRAAALAKKYGFSQASVQPLVVYPQHVSKNYVAELERLITLAFDSPPSSVLSMTKALCAYAMLTKRIKTGESVLIFNLGEEQVSVVKTSLLKTGVAVDGADGHNDPAYLGGNDIDDAVARFLEREMAGRESMGRPSSGEDGYQAEGSLNSKQYLFVKDIKTAKVIFGMPSYERVFKDGVPVCVSRDLYVQRSITRERFLQCTGIADGTGAAKLILDYVTEELDRPVNDGVKKIFFSGGPVETYGLIDFLKNALAKRVKVLTFENPVESYEGVENDGFNILSYEDALYAPALGCALADINKLDIQTVLALSYGLRLFLYEGEIPYLELLVNKGDVLPPEGAEFFTPRPKDKIGLTTSRNSVNSAPMHIMSTVLSREDIAAGKDSHRLEYVTTSAGRWYLRADPNNKRVMTKLVKYAGVKMLNGSENKNAGVIYYYYKNTRVRLIDKVYAVIGVQIDGEGRARPYAENDRARNGNDTVTIFYLWDIKRNGRLIHRAGDREVVYKKDIKFDFDIDEMQFS